MATYVLDYGNGPPSTHTVAETQPRDVDKEMRLVVPMLRQLALDRFRSGCHDELLATVSDTSGEVLYALTLTLDEDWPKRMA